MTADGALFLYGTLLHVPLLEAVLGRPGRVTPARLSGHAVRAVAGESYPTIRPEAGAEAEGVLLEDVTGADRARLDFYEGAYHYALRAVTVATGAGPRAAELYFPTEGQPPAAGPWLLADWQAAHGAATVIAAREVMALFGRMTPEEVRARYPTMLVRAHSAVRAAAEAAPVALRTGMRGDRIEMIAEVRPYTEFFAVSECDLRFPTFAGGMSPPVRRAAFLMGDAVTVVPYDPVRDRVLLIEQFRIGPHLRGDPAPWALEPVAGRIDPGETPEAAARREAVEEARIAVTELHEIGRYYPSPGAVTEWLVSYVGIADLPDGAAVIGGLAGENEDIRGHLVSFDGFMELVASGEAETGPLLLTAYWLAANRGRLRGLA